ncbi:MAG: pyridoxamine 5'-phosphate oxidase family protein [Myxococcota bacterium]
MELERAAIERILARWPVARLATLASDGRAQLVPIVFAESGGALWSPVDGKPKRGPELARLRNLRREPRVCLLLDHYDADWSALWWLRLDGRASVVPASGAEALAAAGALRAKYRAYERGVTPLFTGEPTLIRIAIEKRVGWRASDHMGQLP